MSNVQNQVSLNIDELKGFMAHIISNNRFLQEQGKNSVSVEVIGESGIGKTSSILQMANEQGLNFVKLNLAQIEELGDLVGFPIRQFQLCKTGTNVTSTPVSSSKVEMQKVKKTVPKEVTRMEKQQVQEFEVKVTKKQVLENGRFVTKEVETKVPKLVEKEVPVTITEMVEMEVEEPVTIQGEVGIVDVVSMNSNECIWADEHAVEEYVKRGYEFTGQKRMSYCPPEWIADKQGGGILILDDWNRADIRFIQAVMELVDRQEYISWKLPKDWHIILTANPDNGDYLVNTIDTAQRTRFISVNLKYDVEVWAKWAEMSQIDTRCINFMLMHPELVNSKVNARSITNFFNSISSIPKFEEQLPLIQMIGEGSVGIEFSSMFTSFINNKLDKMLSPKDILLHDNEAYIMGELRNTIGRGNDYRADIASIMGTRIINYSLYHAEKVGITQKEIDRLTRLVTDEETFANDIKYHVVKKILNGNKQKFQKMMTNPEVVKMAMK
jgi:MoxR-like ATPase